MLVALMALATFTATMLGGLFSLKYKGNLHMIMGFTAGVLLGVVSFDILPEIIELLKTVNVPSIYVMIALVAGFLLFHILEKAIIIHHWHEEDYTEHYHPQVGVLSALALSGHSFMDGVGIGLGFQVNTAVGILVALAVISHDFTDGMNTVALMLTHKNNQRKSLLMLILGSITPVLGALSTLLFKVSAEFLVLYLGFFAGFLLYIGAADILPEAHSRKSSFGLLGLTVLGVAFIFVVSRLI